MKKNKYTNICITIICFLILFGYNSLMSIDKKEVNKIDNKESFSLEYTSEGGEYPFETTFKLGDDGSYLYQEVELGNTNKIVEKVEGKFSQEKIKDIINTLINKYKFMSLSEKVPDIDTECDKNYYITIKYNNKIHKVGGYAAPDSVQHAPVFKYVASLMEKLGDNCSKNKQVFSLLYSTKGSSYPVEITLKISEDGSYSYRNFLYKGNKCTIKEQYDGKFTAEKMIEIVDNFIVKNNFMLIPENLPTEGKMDMATSYITIMYNNTLHKIGGYDASRNSTYAPVFNYMNKIINFIKEENDKKVKK